MGLTQLSGGGFPAFGVSTTSTGNGTDTNSPHPLGTEAIDSSGGRYVLARGCSSNVVGGWVLLGSSVASWQPTFMSTGTSLSSGGALGVSMTANTSTSNYSWYQVFGIASALGASTTGTAGRRLWQSTTVAGAVVDSSGGSGIQGAYITSSNASSLWNVHLTYPHMIALTGS